MNITTRPELGVQNEETIERGGNQDGHIATCFGFMVSRFDCGGIPLLLVVFPAGVDTPFIQRNRIA